MAAGDGRFQNAAFRLGVLRGRHALRGRSRVRDSRTGSFLLNRKSVFSRAGDDAGPPDSVSRGLSDGNEPARAHRADPSADEEHDHFSPEPNVPLSPTRERHDAGLLAGDSAATDPVCTFSPHRSRIDAELAQLSDSPWTMRQNP